MHFASTPHDGSRAGGIGLVIGLHVLFVWALASGLVQKITVPAKHKVDARVIEDAPPPPPQPVIRDTEPPPQVLTTQIPMPEVPPDTPPPGPTITARPDVIPSLPDQPQGGGATKAVDPTPPAIVQPLRSAGMLCQTMGRPELPATGTAGVASFQVLGTVRDGRVVDVKLSVLQALGDRKAMRRLAENIESTLKDTYHCSSSGQFQQEFVFRLD